jgi:hypothetical protein
VPPPRGMIVTALLLLLKATAAAGGGGGGPAGTEDTTPHLQRKQQQLAAAAVVFEPPVKVGESNFSHFWMPSSVFKGNGDDLILSIDMAGDGKACPTPGHPQNCSMLYRSQNLGRSWAPVYGNVPGMALPIPQRRSVGNVRTFNFASEPTATAGDFQIFSAMWHDTPSGVVRVNKESIMVKLTGFPALAGPPAASGNAVRLRRDPTQLIGTMYGRLNASNRGCHPFEGKNAPPWPGCNSNFFIASSDEGNSWAFRSHIDWDPATMSPKAEGITESSVTELLDGRLLSVFRLQSNLPLYSSLSSDVGHTWSKPRQTTAWSVYPSVRALPNGALVLTSGRPGLGLWISFDQSFTWQFHNLCTQHNRLFPDLLYHYEQTEVAVQNVSSTGTWPMQTKAYVGLVVLGCKQSSCSILLTYHLRNKV